VSGGGLREVERQLGYHIPLDEEEMKRYHESYCPMLLFLRMCRSGCSAESPEGGEHNHYYNTYNNNVHFIIMHLPPIKMHLN